MLSLGIPTSQDKQQGRDDGAGPVPDAASVAISVGGHGLASVHGRGYLSLQAMVPYSSPKGHGSLFQACPLSFDAMRGAPAS